MARFKCSHCLVRVINTSCWDSTWDQVWKAHDTSLQTPHLCLLEPKMPAEMVTEWNRETSLQVSARATQSCRAEGSRTFFTYLTRWDILRQSFQYSDVVTFNVQNTKYWTAFTDQRFPPILMVGKLLPLQANKENNSRVNKNLKVCRNYKKFFVQYYS